MSAAVISSHELDSIRRRAMTGKLVLGSEASAMEAEASKTALRRAASVDKSSKWKDTLLAQRLAKEDARRKREEDMEAARQAIDKEVRTSGARGVGGARASSAYPCSPPLVGRRRRSCARGSDWRPSSVPTTSSSAKRSA